MKRYNIVFVLCCVLWVMAQSVKFLIQYGVVILNDPKFWWNALILFAEGFFFLGISEVLLRVFGKEKEAEQDELS